MSVAERGPIARVVIDSPLPRLDRVFEYRIPEHLDGALNPGVRVKVPLGSRARQLDAWVLERSAQPSFDGTLAEISKVITAVPVLAPQIAELARRVADRQVGVMSDVLRVAIPRRHATVEKAFIGASAAAGQSERASACESPAEHSERASAGEACESREGAGELASSYSSQARERLLQPGARTALRLPLGCTPKGRPRGFEVLAEIAAARLERGESSIVCVPDHRALGELEEALHDLGFAEHTVRLDAGQSTAARYRAFLATTTDRALIVIGTRAAAYAPVARLGLIMLLDDGSPLFAEQVAPYQHTRDVALLRAEHEGAALVFADHTRSTDVQRLIELGYVDEVSTRRPPRPRITPTALQRAGDPLAERARIPSAAYQLAREALSRGPVLIQVASPGWSRALACARCGEHARCSACGGALVASSASTVRCGVCGAGAGRFACQACGGGAARPLGQGSVRTAEDLGRAFPGALIVRSDGEAPKDRVADKPSIVVATRGAEPVVRGGYAAVLLLDGERLLAREHLRVAEDALRHWSHAVALARDGAPIALVGVDGELARSLALWQQPRFASRELAERRPLQFPPTARLLTLTGEPAAVRRASDELRAVGDGDSRPVRELGPVDTEAGVRTTVLFPYSLGAEVARVLRARVLAESSRQSSTKRTPDGSRERASVVLRVRCDDRDAL